VTQLTTPTSNKTTLVDTTKCIGCRACQVACKQWNEREGEETTLQLGEIGFQNPPTLTAKTYTLISFHELPNEKAPGGLDYIFTMHRCLHCLEPACASACPTTALARQLEARSLTMRANASVAATVFGRAHGACLPQNGILLLQKYKSAHIVPIGPINRCLRPGTELR